MSDYDEAVARYSTESVELNHLEAMALMMLLTLQEDEGGLSEPERAAKEKLAPVLQKLLADLHLGE